MVKHSLGEVRASYQQMLEQFRSSQDEALLMSFNDLGQSLNRAGVAPEIAVEIHAIALANLNKQKADWPYQDNTLLLPLMEVIMAYGVTFRHQLDAQKQASDAQFFQVLEQSRDMIFIVDSSGQLTYSNPAYQSTLSLEGSTGQLPMPVFIDAPDCSSTAELWSMLESGQTFKGVLAVVGDGQGSHFWSVNAFPIHRGREQEQSYHYVFLCDDISHQLAIKKRLRRSERLATLGEIASGVSHEFNNILLIISGFAELVKEDGESSTTTGFADEILKAVEKGQNLNQQILSFAHDRDTEQKPVRLGTMIDRLYPLVKTAIGSDIEFIMDTPDDCIVTLKEDDLCQILTNLCINSKHAIQEKGSTADGCIQCWFEREGADLLVYVQDNGVGMTQSTRQSIYEPFFTTKRTGEGSGLGLSIILRIVDQYHGHVDVSSELGTGSQFKLRLPVNYGFQTS